MPASPKRSSRQSAAFRCSECGWQAAKWVGRCGECQAWGSVAEVGSSPPGRTVPASAARPVVPIGEVDASQAEARPTGVPEFDRVLGGGLVAGAFALVAGEPGIGKSTLMLDVAARAARSGQDG
ncbi:MAG: ATPase domain-containing protein, partial [Phycicoccus sp.]